MDRRYHRWFSPQMGRDMELLVFGHAGAKVLVFPTREGRFFEYEDLGLVGCLQERIEAGELQLWCVDSAYHETFYNQEAHPAERIRRHQAYEEYLLREVLPRMAQANPHPLTIAHGCSLGAFHAANLAFRHPHLFGRLVALSGRYDLSMSVEAFRDLLDGFYSEDVYFHTPTHFLPNLSCESRLAHLRQMAIVLVVGREDPFLDNNRHLSAILRDKGIAHEYYEWDERAHRACYWRRMIPMYL